MAMHVIVTGLIAIKIGDVGQFFMKKSDIFSGIGSGVLIFICAWMIVYNVVYTLWTSQIKETTLQMKKSIGVEKLWK